MLIDCLFDYQVFVTTMSAQYNPKTVSKLSRLLVGCVRRGAVGARHVCDALLNR